MMNLILLPCIMNRTKISVLNKTGLCSLQISMFRFQHPYLEACTLTDFELGIICIYLVTVGRAVHD